MRSNWLLGRVWIQYLVTKDALKVSQRASVEHQRHLFRDLEELKSAPVAAAAALTAARDRADEFVILAMWAEFDRYLIEFFEERTASLRKIRPRPLWVKLEAHISAGVEYWKVDDRLDLLKGLVDPQRIGQAKQVKDFRDGVAHKNPKKRPSAIVDPASTYQLLSEIVAELQTS